MAARNFLIFALTILASTTAHAEFTYRSVTLHGDGSVTYVRPVFVTADGTAYPIRAGEAGRLCRAFGFENVGGVRTNSSLYGATEAVGLNGEGHALAPAPCEYVIDELNCAQASVETGRGFLE